MSVAARRGGRAAGITLVEMLIVVVIGGLFASALLGAFQSGTKATITHESQAFAQADARVAIDQMSRDIRQAVGFPARVGLPLELVHTSELVLHVDDRRAADHTIQPVPSRVRYALVGDDLIREEAAPVVSGTTVTYGPYLGRRALVDRVATGTGAPALFQGVLANGTAVSGAVPAAQLKDVTRIRIRLLSAHDVGPTSVNDEVRVDVTLRNAI